MSPARAVVARALGRRLGPLVDLLWPSRCLGCRAALPRRHHLGVCLACWADLEPLGTACRACAVPRPASARGPLCGACLIAPPAWEAAVAAVVYDGAARRVLLRAKLGGRPELYAPLGRQLLDGVRVAGIARGCRAVVPIPSHPWNDLRRGASPGPELARIVAEGLGLPLRRALRRRWRTPASIKRLGAEERAAALSAGFSTPLRGFRGPVLVVDDVLTSGATASACAAALRRAGTWPARIAVWARTPDPN